MISLLICSATFMPEKTLVTGGHSFSMVRDLSEEMNLRRAQLHALISKINVKTIISEIFFVIINCVFFDYFLMIKSKNVLQLTRTWLWFKFQSVFSASLVTGELVIRGWSSCIGGTPRGRRCSSNTLSRSPMMTEGPTINHSRNLGSNRSCRFAGTCQATAATPPNQ